MKFTKQDWDEFIDKLPKKRIKLLCESYNKSGVINIRHDVDNDPAAALSMAYAEQRLGIKSTYYFLDTAPYWNDQRLPFIITEIACMGHEIGWHNNAITRHLGTGQGLKHCIEEPLHYLRRFYPVTGNASHGEISCYKHKYLNYYIFKESKLNPDFPNRSWGQFSMSDFGLNYEAYHTGHTHYISESGGEWKQDNDAVLKDFKKKKGKLQILIHPQWWA